MKKRIVFNTAINLFSRFGVIAVGLVLIPIIIKGIGVAEYGLFVLAQAIGCSANFIEDGLGITITKFVSEHHTVGDRESVNRVLATSGVMLLSIAVVRLALVTAFAGIFLGHIFKVPPEQLETMAVLTMIMAGCFFVESIVAIFGRILEGLQLYGLIRAAEVARTLFRAGAIVSVLSMGHGLVALGICYFLASILYAILLILCTIFATPYRPPLDPSAVDGATFRNIIRFSTTMILSKIYLFLSFKVDIFLIGVFLNPTFLAVYQIGQRIFDLCRTIMALAASAVMPAASQLGSLKDRLRLRKLYLRGTYYTMVGTLPLTLLVIIFAPSLVLHWVGPELEGASTIARILLATVVVWAPVIIGTEMMVGINRYKPMMHMNLAGTAVNFLLSLLLIWRIGVNGAAIGTLVGFSFMAAMYIVYILRTLEIGWGRFLGSGPLRVAALTAIPIVPAALLGSVYTPASLVIVLSLLCAGLALFAAAFMLCGIPAEDREFFRRMVRLGGH